LGELSAIEQEKEAKQLAQAMGQAIKRKRKELWHEQLDVYNKKCEEAVKKGLTRISWPKATAEECTTAWIRGTTKYLHQSASNSASQ